MSTDAIQRSRKSKVLEDEIVVARGREEMIALDMSLTTAALYSPYSSSHH
jgi:hypothetical protein